jgi:hypothetical protein
MEHKAKVARIAGRGVSWRVHRRVHRQVKVPAGCIAEDAIDTRGGVDAHGERSLAAELPLALDGAAIGATAPCQDIDDPALAAQPWQQHRGVIGGPAIGLLVPPAIGTRLRGVEAARNQKRRIVVAFLGYSVAADLDHRCRCRLVGQAPEQQPDQQRGP